MSAYEIKVSITPLCPCCGKESQSSGFVTESRAPQGVFERDNPNERTDRRVFVQPCTDCFVHRAAVEELIEALEGLDEAYCRAGPQLTRDERMEDRKRLIAARAALARVKGGAA